MKYRKEIDGYDEGNWPEINQWFIEHMAKLESVLRQPLQEISQNM